MQTLAQTFLHPSSLLHRLRVFDSGVMVVQLQSHSEEEMIASALDNVSFTIMNTILTATTQYAICWKKRFYLDPLAYHCISPSSLICRCQTKAL